MPVGQRTVGLETGDDPDPDVALPRGGADARRDIVPEFSFSLVTTSSKRNGQSSSPFIIAGVAFLPCRWLRVEELWARRLSERLPLPCQTEANLRSGRQPSRLTRTPNRCGRFGAGSVMSVNTWTAA